jgi:hypothetical protein
VKKKLRGEGEAAKVSNRSWKDVKARMIALLTWGILRLVTGIVQDVEDLQRLTEAVVSEQSPELKTPEAEKTQEVTNLKKRCIELDKQLSKVLIDEVLFPEFAKVEKGSEADSKDDPKKAPEHARKDVLE